MRTAATIALAVATLAAAGQPAAAAGRGRALATFEAWANVSKPDYGQLAQNKAAEVKDEVSWTLAAIANATSNTTGVAKAAAVAAVLKQQVAAKQCAWSKANIYGEVIDALLLKLPPGTEIPDDVADPAKFGRRLAQAGSPCARAYSVGYYQQLSGDWSADGTSIVLKPTAQKSFTPGANEYYLGLLTNFYWGATGADAPASTPPPAYRWSPFGAPTTNPISRVQTQPYSGGGDNVIKPVIPGAERVMFVLGGDDSFWDPAASGWRKFGLVYGNPGIPLPAQSQAAGRVTTAAVLAGLVNNGWDGIDWDDELSSTAGEGKGFNLGEAATVMRQSAAKHHVWTPIAGSSENFWQWQNTYTMIQSAGGALDGINMMAYAGGMYNIQTAERFPDLMANLQNIANMIQWIHDAGFDLQKVKLGLSTAIHTACGRPYGCPTKPIIDPNTGAWDNDGVVAYRYWLDLVTGTANPFFNNQEYVKYGGLGGVFVWNADLDRPIPVQLRKYIDQRLGTKLATAQ